MYNIIVAFDNKRGIGRENRLPWHFPNDLKYFSKLTRGNNNNAIIMGKNTWESLPKKPLPKRDNLILSTKLNINQNKPKNNYVKSFSSISDIEEFCDTQKYDEIWIIGGAQIYNTFIESKKVNKIYATLIHDSFDCDCFFPEINGYNIISRENTIENETNISYLIYELER